MFGTERRKQFRVGLNLPVSIGLADEQNDGRLGARLVDISTGGALMSLDGLPGWRFSDVLGRNSRLRLEIDLRRFGKCLLQARIERVTAGESSCEFAVRFIKPDAEERRRLQLFLDRYMADEANADMRRRHKRYLRRARNRRLLVAALVTAVGLGLTFLCITMAEVLPEVLPEWFARGRDAVYREARDVRRQAVEEELRLMRESGRDPAEVYRKLPPDERERIRAMFTAEERRQIKTVLDEEKPR
jgi:PilZ domain